MDLDTQYIAALLAAGDGDDATAHKILDGDDGGVKEATGDKPVTFRNRPKAGGGNAPAPAPPR